MSRETPRRALLFGCVAAAIGLLLLIGTIWSAWHRPTQASTNVLFILVDTLRADRLGGYGNVSKLTPFLDRLAAESVVYERAYAPSSWTVPSIASIFLARYPSEHQLVVLGAILPDYQLTLAEVLHDHGFRTAGLSTNLQISGDTGYGQGFETFDLLLSDSFVKGDATQVNRAALAWLDRTAADQRPFFLYLQYMEPHGPYRLHAGITAARSDALAASDVDLNERLAAGSAAAGLGNATPWNFPAIEVDRLQALYDGEVKYLDGHLAELFAQLERRNLLQNTVVVVTADHGEEFGEHDVFDHGVSLFEPAIHVPLLIRPAGGDHGRRIRRPVEMAGLAPALLQRLGIPIPPEFHVPALPLDDAAAPGATVDYVFSELIKTNPKDFRLHRQALLDDRHKLLVTQRGERVFYDLASDRAEAHPMKTASFAETFGNQLALLMKTMVSPSAPTGAPIDAATRERLRSLGYAQ